MAVQFKHTQCHEEEVFRLCFDGVRFANPAAFR